MGEYIPFLKNKGKVQLIIVIVIAQNHQQTKV